MARAPIRVEERDSASDEISIQISILVKKIRYLQTNLKNLLWDVNVYRICDTFIDRLNLFDDLLVLGCCFFLPLDIVLRVLEGLV